MNPLVRQDYAPTNYPKVHSDHTREERCLSPVLGLPAGQRVCPPRIKCTRPRPKLAFTRVRGGRAKPLHIRRAPVDGRSALSTAATAFPSLSMVTRSLQEAQRFHSVSLKKRKPRISSFKLSTTKALGKDGALPLLARVKSSTVTRKVGNFFLSNSMDP